MTEYIKKNPIQLDSRNELVKYVCELHNDVNIRLNKPVVDCKMLADKLCGECDDCKRKSNLFS